MTIVILNFEPNRKNSRIGYVDFRIIHSPDKEETFRGVGYFENQKTRHKYLSFAAVQREGNWKPRYERKPSLDKLFGKVIPEVDKYINNHSVQVQDELF